MHTGYISKLRGNKILMIHGERDRSCDEMLKASTLVVEMSFSYFPMLRTKKCRSCFTNYPYVREICSDNKYWVHFFSVIHLYSKKRTWSVFFYCSLGTKPNLLEHKKI